MSSNKEANTLAAPYLRHALTPAVHALVTLVQPVITALASYLQTALSNDEFDRVQIMVSVWTAAILLTVTGRGAASTACIEFATETVAMDAHQRWFFILFTSTHSPPPTFETTLRELLSP